MSLVDVLTLLVILAVLWTFLPERLQDGIGPTIHRTADLVRAVARPCIRWLATSIRWLFGVNRFEEAPAASTYVLSSSARTDGRTDGTFGADAAAQSIARLRVDRTRAAVVAIMVDSGWKVEEIRAVVKGQNSDISEEVQAARERLPAQHRYPELTKDGRPVAEGK